MRGTWRALASQMEPMPQSVLNAITFFLLKPSTTPVIAEKGTPHDNHFKPQLAKLAFNIIPPNMLYIQCRCLRPQSTWQACPALEYSECDKHDMAAQSDQWKKSKKNCIPGIFSI